MVSVRIRGIYSTALTKLLLDNSFEIVQPSEVIKKRFNLPGEDYVNVPPDLNVHNRLDRQGIIVTGNMVSLENLIDILRSTLDDVVFRNPLRIPWETSYQYSHGSYLSNMQLSAVSSVDIEFPGLSKKRLDEIRATVTPTVTGHHYYKACGGRISSMVDIAEKMLEEGCLKDDVEALLKENVWSILPKLGSRINMENAKIDGQIFNLGSAKIARFYKKDGRLILLRRFFKKGVYDGLKVPKDEGDYAISDVVIGNLSFRTRYFSRNEEYKGTYININTPIELYPMKIRYVDLEADICVWPDGKIKKIDNEKLEEVVSRGFISERIAEISNREIERNLNSISLEEEREAYRLL